MAAPDQGAVGVVSPTVCNVGGGKQAKATDAPGEQLRVAVLGMGSFGTALGYVLCHNGHSVMLLGRDQQVSVVALLWSVVCGALAPVCSSLRLRVLVRSW
jgi:NAD-dependent glycerol-3-phosphate dehydrogenase N-terminus